MYYQSIEENAGGSEKKVVLEGFLVVIILTMWTTQSFLFWVVFIANRPLVFISRWHLIELYKKN